MTQREKDAFVRKKALEIIERLITNCDEYGECLRVATNKSSTKDNYSLAIPTLDAENNETWFKIDISVPRGERGGDGYDGYTEANLFAEELIEKEKAEKARAEAKRRAEEEKAKMAELRKKRYLNKIEHKEEDA